MARSSTLYALRFTRSHSEILSGGDRPFYWQEALGGTRIAIYDLATMGEEWRLVDEGWGREAVDFAALSEPGNCREYVALHQELGIQEGERVLDLACGSGLAIELLRARGAIGTGIDASRD